MVIRSQHNDEQCGLVNKNKGRGPEILTVPQNWFRQCGHCPTIRRAAELHWVSAVNWQRFLAGIMRCAVFG